jgi:hypothetical protein
LMPSFGPVAKWLWRNLLCVARTTQSAQECSTNRDLTDNHRLIIWS